MTTVPLARRRADRTMFIGAALGATGTYVGVAAAPLVGEDLTGSVALAGLPGAIAIIGTAVGASLVTAVFRRATRRSGLAGGYTLGAAGALLAFLAVRTGSFPLVLVGSALFGVGQAATQLTRYVVADLHEPDHRGRALGWIVWAGTVGGVAGPNLLAPAGEVARSLGQPALAGPYLVGAGVMATVALGYLLLLRPDPAILAVSDPATSPDVALSPTAASPRDTPTRASDGAGSVWRLPTVRAAIVVMITGQVVMVWLMSMTPVHIRESGGDLGRIGLILSAHILGMFALAPVAGWLDDRHGSVPTIAAGLGMLAASAVLAATVPVGGALMALALFLLGLGWSFGFVAGSAMLTRDVPPTRRALVQGRVETAVWLSSAAASLGAGLLLDVVGYVGLAVVGLAALVLPISVVVRRHDALAAT